MNPRMMMGGRPSLPGRRPDAKRAGAFSPQQEIAGAGLRNAGTGGGGGLKGMLSRFLPGSGGGSAAASAPAAASGGAGAGLQGIQNLASPASLSSMLGNVQKVLGVAQSGLRR
nr:VrrA/YqfQ family protein [Bacillus velezensis]